MNKERDEWLKQMIEHTEKIINLWVEVAKKDVEFFAIFKRAFIPSILAKFEKIEREGRQ